MLKLRIDWMSLESRRGTGNYDLLLKLLTGDLTGCRSSHLAGLEDVLEQCIETRESLMEMFNQATVDIALQSLSHIREVVVVYVFQKISNRCLESIVLVVLHTGIYLLHDFQDQHLYLHSLFDTMSCKSPQLDAGNVVKLSRVQNSPCCISVYSFHIN
jgi:hypothetical protein